MSIQQRHDKAGHQGNDGTAHVTYFDQRTQASFVWDASDERIEVSLGGYSEPVTFTVALDDLHGAEGRQPGLVFLPWFENAAREIADSLPTYGLAGCWCGLPARDGIHAPDSGPLGHTFTEEVPA